MPLITMDAEVRMLMNEHHICINELAACMSIPDDHLLHLLRSDLSSAQRDEIRGYILELANRREP